MSLGLGFCRAALAAAALLLLCALPVIAYSQQQYPDMASEPDPGSFVKRADTGLTLLGDPLRFAGADLAWLGLRQDAGSPARRPPAYEVNDALQTVQALGGTVIRAATLAGTAGCALCLEPEKGRFNADAFASLDATLKAAGDLGIHVILPLLGPAADCTEPGTAQPDAAASDTICAYLGWQGLTGRDAFFTNPAVRAAFLAHVRAVLIHVNALTGVAYRDDPTILAWENCTACGEGSDPASVAAWTEAVGRAIKQDDRFHLYENGAFAGHILPHSPHPVSAADAAPPSVDVVGDILPAQPSEAATRAMLAAATGAVNAAGRAYALDGIDAGPARFKTEADLETFLNAVVRQRKVAGALVSGLQAHADTGGYLPAPPENPAGGTALYFPGRTTADMPQDEMVTRIRALRRFEFAMTDVLEPPSYLLTPKPEIIGAQHGRLLWRGAAGALDYTIERSPNPDTPNSWQVVCDRCVTDNQAAWQDPSPPGGAAWYRIMPFNINGHKALPSAPYENR
jgi:hypothetical protein